jgi:hypothetical protein
MDNETEIVEVRLPLLPKGYRYTGEYRQAVKGDILYQAGYITRWEGVTSSSRYHHMIEKIKWVPRTGEVFYIVTDTGRVRELHYLEDSIGEIVNLVEAGNYFKTKELAMKASRAVSIVLKGCDHDL